MLAVTNGKQEAELQYIEMLQRKLIDGIIFLHSTLSAEELSEFAASSPMVLASEIVQGADLPLVTIDNKKAAYEATRFLIDNGHRTVALASAGDLYYSSTLRRDGYATALQDCNIPYDPDLVTNEGFSFNAGRRSAERMLQWSKLPDAVFAVADSVAIGMVSKWEKISPSSGLTTTRSRNTTFRPLQRFLSPSWTSVKKPWSF